MLPTDQPSEMNRPIRSTGIVLAGLALAAVGAGYVTPTADIAESHSLLGISLDAFSPSNKPPYDFKRALSNGLERADLPSIGSGLTRNAAGEWFGLTDRGPLAKLPEATAQDQRRVLVIPEFAPTIVRFELEGGRIIPREFITLRDATGVPLSGRHISNRAEDGVSFASRDAAKDDQPLPPDPSGVDPEGIRCRPDGTFVIAEEFAPSVLVVDRAGRVMVRLVPQEVKLTGAQYPVKGILPAVLRQRQPNRGFEALALSEDGNTAYALLQSPPVDESKPNPGENRHLHVVELDLSDLAAPRVRGHYLALAGLPAEHPGTQLQQQIKLNDAEWIGTRRLLVLEQAHSTSALRIVDLNGATNLLELGVGEAADSNVTQAELERRGIRVAPSELFCWLKGDGGRDDFLLEGLCVLQPDRVAVSNDNDYGRGGVVSHVWILKLPRNIPRGAKLK